MTKKDIDCSTCYYARYGGCSCEDEMVAGCIPTPMSDEDWEEQAEHALTHFKATIKEIEDIVSNPNFTKWFKKHHKESVIKQSATQAPRVSSAEPTQGNVDSTVAHAEDKQGVCFNQTENADEG
ncbi:MAG: hypothetical protein WC365_06360 [Candidatus Babeliales bacterium]|jgi:hypothetical protein